MIRRDALRSHPVVVKLRTGHDLGADVIAGLNDLSDWKFMEADIWIRIHATVVRHVGGAERRILAKIRKKRNCARRQIVRVEDAPRVPKAIRQGIEKRLPPRRLQGGVVKKV